MQQRKDPKIIYSQMLDSLESSLGRRLTRTEEDKFEKQVGTLKGGGSSASRVDQRELNEKAWRFWFDMTAGRPATKQEVHDYRAGQNKETLGQPVDFSKLQLPYGVKSIQQQSAGTGSSGGYQDSSDPAVGQQRIDAINAARQGITDYRAAPGSSEQTTLPNTPIPADILTNQSTQSGLAAEITGQERELLNTLDSFLTAQSRATYGQYDQAGNLIKPGAYQNLVEQGKKDVELIQNFLYGSKDETSGTETPGIMQLVTPQVLESAGYSGSVDSTGKLTGVHILTDQERLDQMDPLSRKTYEAAVAQADYQLKALRGELDADPELERQLKQQEEMLREGLSRRLGPGYEASSVGQQALQRFGEGATRLRTQSRQGQVGQAAGLTATSVGTNVTQTNARNNATANLLSLSPPTTQPILAQAYQNANAVGAGVQAGQQALLQGYNTAYQPILSLYGINQQVATAREASNQSGLAGLGQLIGTIAPLAVSAFTGNPAPALAGAANMGMAT